MFQGLQSFAQSYTTSSGDAASTAGGAAVIVLYIAVIAVIIVALWKVFTKAGRPGWAAIVPFYNGWVLAEISGRPGWFGLVAMLISAIPFVGWIASIIMGALISMDLAVKFGKTKAFGIIGLLIFSFVGFPMLAFGKATYNASAPTDTPQFGTPTSGSAGSDPTAQPTGTPIYGAPVAPQQPVSSIPPTETPQPPTPPASNGPAPLV